MVDLQMFQQRLLAGAAGVLLRLVVVVVLVDGGSESRGSSAVATCRQQLVFDVYGYSCDVIVTLTSNDDDTASAVVLMSDDGVIPSNASALRLTLRRADGRTGQNGSRRTVSVPPMHLAQLRSLEVDVSETRSFPAGLLSKLGAVSLQRLSVIRSASTEASEYQLRLPTSAEGTFATSNSSMSTLFLSDLGIEELPLKTFDGLTRLCFLFVNNNRLRSLPAGLFDDLCQLSSLSLARNCFVDVDDLSLSGSGHPRPLRCGRGLASLRLLDLHGNRLRRLRSGAFQSLRSVVEINLSGNELSAVDAGAFSGLVELRTLYIDANRLITVTPAMFDGLTGLTTLDVSYNRLSNVTSGPFRNLTALRTLRLRENEIQIIGRDAWTGLDQLTELDLAYNRLTSVDESMFSELCGLRQLDLSDNELTTANTGAFTCLTALERLELSGNLLSDPEQHRLEERQWWSKDVRTGPSASCDKCATASLTTISETNRVHSNKLVQTVDPTASLPSSSSVVMGTTQILAVALTACTVVAMLFLLLSAALYVYLLKRRRAVIDCHQRCATSTYSRQSGSLCTLDNSIQGIYVKIHT